MKIMEAEQLTIQNFEPCTLLLDDASCITFTPLDGEGIDVIFNNTIIPYEVLIAERQIIAGCQGYSILD